MLVLVGQLVDDPEILALDGLLTSRLDLLASEDATELAWANRWGWIWGWRAAGW